MARKPQHIRKLLKAQWSQFQGLKREVEAENIKALVHGAEFDTSKGVKFAGSGKDKLCHAYVSRVQGSGKDSTKSPDRESVSSDTLHRKSFYGGHKKNPYPKGKSSKVRDI